MSYRFTACVTVLAWAHLMISPLLHAAAENHEGITKFANLAYARVDGKPLRLDLYLPAHAAQPTPVIMWVHGGGWCSGSKESPGLAQAARLGFAIASIDYRFSQEAVWPAQIYDCKAAVRWLRANASKYHLNPDKIGAAGASAGGHLAALLGTTANRPDLEGTEGNPGISSRVAAVCDFFGPTNFIDFDIQGPANPAIGLVTRLLGGPVHQKLAEAREASPITYVSPQTCPFFIAHGDSDTVVPLQQSIELNEALKKAGVESTLEIVKGGGHGFNAPATFANAILFFEKHLGS